MTSLIKIYGFSGKLGAGKNFLAEKIFAAMLPKGNTLIMALADQIKVDCCVKDGVNYRHVFHEKDEESRRLLQTRGTEEGRMKYGADLWIRTIDTWLQVYADRGVDNFIITDLRFPDEVQWVKSRGGHTFRVIAPQRNHDALQRESGGDAAKMQLIRDHASETSLDDYQGFDYVIENDYGQEIAVTNQLRNIVRELTSSQVAELTIFCDLDDTICICSQFYRGIVEQVIERLRTEIKASKGLINKLLNRHIWSFEKRYFTREDFSLSLKNMVQDAYVESGRPVNMALADEVYQLGFTVFDQYYAPLHTDTISRVRQMAQMGQLVIFTLGDHVEQMRKISQLGLLDLQVEIFTHKDENMFRYLQHKYPSQKYVMIGDSRKRDILPAKKAGISNLILVDSKCDGALVEEYSEGNMTDKIVRIPRLNLDLIQYMKKLS